MLIMKDVKGRNENGIRMNNESNTHKKNMIQQQNMEIKKVGK